MELFPILQINVNKLVKHFDRIPQDRRRLLETLSQYVATTIRSGERVQLNFICTHNSRRSHMAQLWAQTAAYYYGVGGVVCYSGGTEATAFNPRAVNGMGEAGFRIQKTTDGNNPVYEVFFADGIPPIYCFSKTYDTPENPTSQFAAVMTCSDADKNCPLVAGAQERFSVTYDDPKAFDGTLMEVEKYRERVRQIGREMLYVFSQVKKVE